MMRPTTIEVREATVGPLLGTMPVSGEAIVNIGVVDAERLGGNLSENGVGALAELGVRDQHAHLAFGRDVHAGQRIEIHLARAGEARAVIEGGDAQAALDWTVTDSRGQIARVWRDNRSP